jgi:hypothetical protein
LLREWNKKTKATKREIQSLVGKLNFIGCCVKPGRIFISRILNWLRDIYDEKGTVLIPKIIKKKNLEWWDKCLVTYNGISMMIFEEWSKPDAVFFKRCLPYRMWGYIRK